MLAVLLRTVSVTSHPLQSSHKAYREFTLSLEVVQNRKQKTRVQKYLNTYTNKCNRTEVSKCPSAQTSKTFSSRYRPIGRGAIGIKKWKTIWQIIIPRRLRRNDPYPFSSYRGYKILTAMAMASSNTPPGLFRRSKTETMQERNEISCQGKHQPKPPKET